MDKLRASTNPAIRPCQGDAAVQERGGLLISRLPTGHDCKLSLSVGHKRRVHIRASAQEAWRNCAALPDLQREVTRHIDIYHPFVASDHDQSCAGLCTNRNSVVQDDSGCDLGPRRCWCPDGSLTYAEFQAKHAELTVAQAEGR